MQLILGPVHTGRGAPRNGRTQIMEHIVVNGSVHTACKQHQRVCKQICVQICFCILCERDLRVKTCCSSVLRVAVLGDQSKKNNVYAWTNAQKRLGQKLKKVKWPQNCGKKKQAATHLKMQRKTNSVKSLTRAQSPSRTTPRLWGFFSVHFLEGV